MLLVVSVSLVVVVSAVALRFPTGSLVPPPSQPPGLPYSSAATLGQSVADNVSGAPWRLIAVDGIVSPGRVVPLTVDVPAGSCQSLPGPTVWNGSGIPSWTGSLASGVSPFWSLIFVNATGFLLPIETLNESVHADPAISPSSECGRALEVTMGSSQPFVDATTVAPTLDSTTVGEIAWAAEGSRFDQENPAVAIYYVTGLSPISGFSSPGGFGWAVTYTVCSLPGFAHDQAEADVLVWSPSVPPTTFNGTASCTLSRYNVSLLPINNATGPIGGQFHTFELNLTSICTDCVPAPIYNPVGVSSWLVNLTVTNGYGGGQAISVVDCLDGEWAESTCVPASDGWFAALAAPSGYWLDLFDSQNGTPGWALPNVAIFSNDTLVVYLPPELNSVALNLTVSSTYQTVPVTGSAPV